MLSAPVRRGAASLAARFRAGKPFPHVVIDGFLDAAFARALIPELPRPDAECFATRGDDGLAIARTPGALGPAMARLDALTRSPEFLGWLSLVGGVPGIKRNEAGECGGLFSYADDAELDVHVDSNDVDAFCAQVGHRRKVNLLLYLTPGWRKEWGGEFELYADPSRPAPKRVSPLFNRAVFFDSNDRSWHGVGPITRPGARATLDRLVLIINFYSTVPAPGARKDPPHFNILIPRPLPARLRPGRAPSLPELVEVARLLSRRESKLASLRAFLRSSRELRAPAPEGADAPAPLGFLDALPPGVRPGLALTRRAYAGLRRSFDSRDKALRRLYLEHYRAIKRLRARAPELLPPSYY